MERLGQGAAGGRLGGRRVGRTGEELTEGQTLARQRVAKIVRAHPQLLRGGSPDLDVRDAVIDPQVHRQVARAPRLEAQVGVLADGGSVQRRIRGGELVQRANR